jgi:hypothetical protein
MTEEQLTVNPNLITMQDSGELDLELMMGDPHMLATLIYILEFAEGFAVISTLMTDQSSPKDNTWHELPISL